MVLVLLDESLPEHSIYRKEKSDRFSLLRMVQS